MVIKGRLAVREPLFNLKQYIMIILLVLTWYLIGSVGGLYFMYKINPIVTGWDIVFLVTLGGVCGLLTILCALPFLPYEDYNWYKWLSKKVF